MAKPHPSPLPAGSTSWVATRHSDVFDAWPLDHRPRHGDGDVLSMRLRDGHEDLPRVWQRREVHLHCGRRAGKPAAVALSRGRAGAGGRRDRSDTVDAVMTGLGLASRLLPSSRLLMCGVLPLIPGTPGLSPATAPMTVQEAILRAKPAVVVVASQIGADITLNCGTRPVRVSPAPFVETGSGWFVDGRGYLVTSAHVVAPPAALSELKKAAIQEGCV